jgi:four helix bundle protein
MENAEVNAENTSDATPNVKKPYDLEERTALFGEAIIRFLRTLPRDEITIPLIGQMVRSGTSVGANYCEADDAVSKKDFRHRISICKKESRETKFWIRMMATAAPESKRQGRILWREAKELHLIFSAIWRRGKS